MMYFKQRGQQGYFLVLSVILILVIGVMGSLIAYMLAGRARIAPAELQGMRAFYVAESGLEIASRLLVGTGVASPLTCATLTGAAAVTNASVLNGTFTATAVNNALYSASSTLSSGVTSTSNSLPLNSVSGFAAHGRVRIGSEAIDYAAISGSSLVGLTRGASSTTAASHSSGAAVSESICLVNVSAGVPSIAAPLYRRQLQMAVEVLTASEAWLSANRKGSSFTLARWNEPTAGAWNDYSFADNSNRENLMSINMSSTTNGWSVGLEKSNDFTILYWNGSTWSVANVSGACNGQDLYGVATVSDNEAWAVGFRYRNGCGNSGPQRYTILKWNGSTWTELAPSSIPADSNNNEDLYAVSMLDANNDGVAELGFAVGDNGTILKYNGSVWSVESSPTSRPIRGVNIVSATEAWAVGNNGEILKWNGSTWSLVSSPTSTRLNSIRMLDTNGNGAANMGWAVGQSGVIIYYNGSSWVLQESGGNNFFGVSIASSTDVWAAGESDSIMHWNGTSWSAVTSPLSGNPRINSVDVVPGSASITGSLVGSWQQTFR